MEIRPQYMMLLIFWYILEFLILYNHTLLQHC
jgi:hypothetical protein